MNARNCFNMQLICTALNTSAREVQRLLDCFRAVEFAEDILLALRKLLKSKKEVATCGPARRRSRRRSGLWETDDSEFEDRDAGDPPASLPPAPPPPPPAPSFRRRRASASASGHRESGDGVVEGADADAPVEVLLSRRT